MLETPYCVGVQQMAIIKQLTVPQFEALFPDEAACDAYLIAKRWPHGVSCPRCGSCNVYGLKSMDNKWECPDCRQGGAYRFSHLVGTVFENTNVDLRVWFRVIHLMLVSKKGISALQVQRMMGFGSYRTAHYMCMRIRTGMQNEEFNKLMGIVEVDEPLLAVKPRIGTRIAVETALAARVGPVKKSLPGLSAARATSWRGSFRIPTLRHSKALYVVRYPKKSACSALTSGTAIAALTKASRTPLWITLTASMLSVRSTLKQSKDSGLS